MSIRAVGDEVVRRRADAGEQGGILRLRHPAEARRPGVVRPLAVAAPALERVDHPMRISFLFTNSSAP